MYGMSVYDGVVCKFKDNNYWQRSGNGVLSDAGAVRGIF